jgi:iron complex transport system permease protein
MAKTPLSFRKALAILLVMVLLLLVVGFFCLMIGSSHIPIGEGLRAMLDPSDRSVEGTRTILLQIRLPRIILAMIVGAGLSIAGAALQALLRNPLAEPYILGISSGGTVGALVAFSLGLGMSQITTPLFSFFGSGLVMLLVFTLGHRRGLLDTNALLLSGVMVGAFFSALILLFTALVNQDIRSTFLWLIGNLSGAQMRSIVVIAPLIVLASLGLMTQSRALNLIATGDETATHLGVEVERVRRASYLLASFITGMAVSLSGVIGFVGLVVPHTCRLLFGPDHRLLMPASFLGGAIFLLLCDLVSRILLAPSEIPVGVVTATLGAPVFIYLLKKRW